MLNNSHEAFLIDKRVEHLVKSARNGCDFSDNFKIKRLVMNHPRYDLVFLTFRNYLSNQNSNIQDIVARGYNAVIDGITENGLIAKQAIEDMQKMARETEDLNSNQAISARLFLINFRRQSPNNFEKYYRSSW
jgi:hypothetical protein